MPTEVTHPVPAMCLCVVQVVSGTFDDLGQMDPANTAYWEQLDAQVEKHTQVKHVRDIVIKHLYLLIRYSCRDTPLSSNKITWWWDASTSYDALSYTKPVSICWCMANLHTKNS